MLKNMKKTGAQLSSNDLLDAERKLNFIFPTSYKDFLLTYNGGSPVESYIDFDGKKLNLPGEEIKRFYGLGGKPTNDLIHKMDSIGDNLPQEIIYIANTHGGNFFLLSMRQDSYEQVFYKDHEYEDQSPFEPDNEILPESIVKVADSFGEFISQLYDNDE